MLKDQELKIDIWRGEKAARPCCLVDMVKRPRPFFLGNIMRVCACVCVVGVLIWIPGKMLCKSKLMSNE